jgi:hypothetical protein
VVTAVAISLVWNIYQNSNLGRRWNLSPSGRVGTTATGKLVPPTPAAPGTGTGTPEDLLQVLASAPPVEPGQYSPEEMAKLFPAFQHRPFASAGFNAVMLPFSYSDAGNIGDSSEAMALDALVSSDLDWSPGCYCARHAFFVFKRDRDLIYTLQRGYSPSLIQLLTRHWQATHAVGGKLIRTADGYKGTLEIYDANGNQAFRRTYDAPHTFWNLLGDMDVDAMTFLDAKPSDKLASYLHQPRCRHWQSLIDFGSAAFMEERSPEEFALYEKILKADPDFALVRYWYANQRYWLDRDSYRYRLEDGAALAARIEPAELEVFDPRVGGGTFASKYPQWIDRAAELTSEDCPIVIYCRLAEQCYGGQSREAVFARGLRVAAKYPNAHSMVRDLAWQTQDQFLVAGLLEAGLQDLYLPGVGKEAENGQLALAMICGGIGRDDVAMELLSEGGPEQPPDNLCALMIALSGGGRYGEAVQMYQLLPSGFHAKDAIQVAAYAAFAAVVEGNKPLLDQILRQQHDVLADKHLADVFQAFKDGLDGKAVDPQQFVRPDQILDFPLIWRQFLLAWCDAKKGASQYHRLITEMGYSYPTTRLIWIAEDDYQRRDPSPDAAAFYDYLAWLFGDDPWVKTAITDFHNRGGGDPAVDPAMLRADLERNVPDSASQSQLEALDWKHVLTPWRVAACVHQLLRQGNVKDAEAITGLYKKHEGIGRDFYRYSLACEMVRRVEQSPKSN